MYSIANEGMRGRRVGREASDGDDAGPLVDASSAVSPDVSLVIPTKNEEEGIVTCIERAVTAFEELGVRGEIIVSDSSTDRTPEIAREHGARVVTPDRIGYGYAYRYGFEHARGDLIAMGDGDTTYDFRELPKLVERFESSAADIVMGNRLDGDIKPGAMPTLHRLVGNPLLTGVLNAFYTSDVGDAHSGMRVFQKDVLETLDLGTDGMEFASEMLMEASAAGLTVEEVPITYHPREGDATIHTFRDGWRHVKYMLVNAPGHTFSAPAATFCLGGLGLLLVALMAGAGEVTLPEFHLGIAGGLLILTGYQVGGMALVTSTVSDPVRPPDDPITRAVTRWFTLERGLVAGTALLAASAAVSLFAATTAAVGVAAVVGSILGVQTGFYALCLDLLLEDDAPATGQVAAPATVDRAPTIDAWDESEAD